MPVHRVTLDMHKAASVIRPEVYVRVGDHNQTLEATLYDNGEAYKIPEGGYAKLQIKGPRGVIVRSKPMDTVPNDEGLTIVRCIIPPPSYTDVGIAEQAYVAVYASEGTEPESSSDIKLIVQPGTTDELYVRYYDEEIEQTKSSLTDEEASRQAAERKRQEAEEERKAAEKTRKDGEATRKQQEEKRQQDTATAIQNAEQATSTANAAANTATTAAADAKSATDASKAQTAKAKEATDAANTATDAANTAASGADAAAERANDAASGADAAAERAGTSAGKADAAASNAEDKATLADTAAQRADTAAQAAEDGEAERDRKDQERDDKISEWEAAEEERKSAELKRAEAATAQAKQQADNNAAQAANDEAQARNNADQQQNNLAAQGRLTRILKPGEYDPDSREPTIEGDLTHVFAVPTKEFEEAGAALETAQREFDAAKHAMSDAGGEGPQFEGQLVGAQAVLDEAREVYEAVNRYVEWLWLLDAEGSGFWELYGSGNATLPDPISTEEYDRMWAGENVETKHVAYSSGVSYDTTKTKSAIADAVKAQAEVQSTTDTAQNAAIEAAQKAGDDAASALGTFKTDQGRKDEEQDTAIEKAQKRADEAYNHLPDVVSSEANGILPAFPSEGGPFLPVVKDGELIGWQELPTFDTTQPGFVPVAPEGEVKVLLSTGWGDYSAGGMPDSRPLKASIAKATASKEAARVQGSGDYDFGTNVTTQAAMDAIGSAIEAAQAVLDAYDDPSTTQAMLDAATKELDAALATFESTFTPLAPDKSGLTELESRYTELKTGVSTSTNGKDVAFGTMWVTSAEQQAADTALQTARTNVEAATKQSQIKSACDTLKTALDTYQSARKTATADYAALDKAIQDATAAKKDVLTSDSGGSDLPAGSNYVTSAQMETFNAALSTAQSTRSTASTQAALDSATSTLTAATATFKGQIQKNISVYGVQFSNFPTTTKGTRTDEAAKFGDVKPAVSNGSGSSPFDEIAPWSEMKAEDRAGGRMVKIPKFYYKLTQNGKGVNVQIATGPMDGFKVSPAHMDRNDGKGEREAVYVGRYHCATGTYKSTSKVMPANNATKANMISSIKSIGGTYYMMDFATRFTIWLLYLVETAEWNSQNLIGFGCGNNSAPQNMGYTDDMTYCTGTSLASATAKGLGTQYRNIEGLWDNVYDFLSGCYNDSQGFNIITDAAKLGDSSGGKSVGTPQSGWCAGLTVSETGGFPVFYNSSTSGGGENVGTCDYWYFDASFPVVYAGGNYYQYSNHGMFFLSYSSATVSNASCGCRLLELP